MCAHSLYTSSKVREEKGNLLFYLFRQKVEGIGFAPKLHSGGVFSWKKPKMLVSSKIPPAGILQGMLEIN